MKVRSVGEPRVGGSTLPCRGQVAPQRALAKSLRPPRGTVNYIDADAEPCRRARAGVVAADAAGAVRHAVGPKVDARRAGVRRPPGENATRFSRERVRGHA